MKLLNARLLPILALFLTACDGYIGMTGTTYRQVDPAADAKSFVVVDEALPQGLTLEPLSGVELTLYNHSEDVGRTDKDAKLWSDEGISEVDGTFRMGSVAAPGDFESAIEAKKAGCQGVLHKFQHDRDDHRTNVVLVCSPLK